MFSGLFFLDSGFVEVEVGEAASSAREEEDEDEEDEHDLTHFHVFEASSLMVSARLGVPLQRQVHNFIFIFFFSIGVF